MRYLSFSGFRKKIGRLSKNHPLRCMNDVKKGVAHLLTYVDNVKALSLIRDAVYVLLKEENQADDPNDEVRCYFPL